MCAQYLPWLVNAARATGYPVVELRGWRGHNHGPMADHVYGVVCHHTAGPDPYPGARNDFPSINVVRNGRIGLPGPLSQLGLGWHGTIYIVSDGLAYHAGTGSWRGITGNSRMIGIEAEDAGDGDWSAPQRDCYPRLVASLLDWLGQEQHNGGWTCGHKEWAPRRKIDPAGIDMGGFRGEVHHYLRNPNLLRKGSQPPPAKPGVQGEIGRVYRETPGLADKLGAPTTPELPTADGRGRFNRFEHLNGHIYWYPGLGAWAVYGAIYQAYKATGWETGSLGYPLSHEFDGPTPGSRISLFEHGWVGWTSEGGATAHH
jgi:hypothetical protein